MRIPLLDWFLPRLKERLLAILFGELALEAETEAALRHAANQERMEDEARRLDADGKPQLAEGLRRRAHAISPDAPGATALASISNLAEDDFDLDSMRIGHRDELAADIPLAVVDTEPNGAGQTKSRPKRKRERRQ